MTTRSRALGALVLAALVSSPAFAADGFSPVLGVGLTAGGEKLASVQYTDGSSDTIKSGGLIHMFGGVEYQSGKFALQANVGYHVHDTNANNGSVKFSRWPVELLAFWHVTDQVRLGAGVRKADNAKLTSSGAASNLGGLKLEGEAGTILQGEYFFDNSRFSTYLRYVAEDYKVGGLSVSGKHVGIGVVARF
jgi:opacity protein-like surface antigen